MQTVRTEATENDAKDDVERMQDYGFAGNPVSGQGLVLTINGTAVVLRLDRLDNRPNLAPLEVCLWHDEGHNVTLRAGKVVEANCDTFRVNATVKVELNTPLVAASAAMTAQGRVTGVVGVTAAGKALEAHNHPDLTSGGNTGPNN